MVRPLVVFLFSPHSSCCCCCSSSSSSTPLLAVLQHSPVQSPSSVASPLPVKAGWLAGWTFWTSWTLDYSRLGRTEWDGDRVSYFHHPHFPSGSSIASFLNRGFSRSDYCCDCCDYCLLLAADIPADGLDHALLANGLPLANYCLLVLFGFWVSFRKHPERPSLRVPTREKRLVVALVLANG